MPIAALNDQNDARGSAWLLARMARDSIAEPQRVPVNPPVMNSLYRLLEAYRAHGFFGFDYQPSPSRDAESFSLAPPAERGFNDLKIAFDQALEKVFGSQSSHDEGISSVEKVLVAVTYPDRPQVPPESREKAVEFLDSFIEGLDYERI